MLWIAFVNWKLHKVLWGLAMPSFSQHDLARNLLITTVVVGIGLLGIVRRNRGDRPSQLFSRVGNGRLVQGVCVGLSEYFGVSVTLWRVAFIVLFLTSFGGGPSYLLLDLAIPRHPDDREGLLGFRLLRRLHA